MTRIKLFYKILLMLIYLDRWKNRQTDAFIIIDVKSKFRSVWKKFSFFIKLCSNKLLPITYYWNSKKFAHTMTLIFLHFLHVPVTTKTTSYYWRQTKYNMCTDHISSEWLIWRKHIFNATAFQELLMMEKQTLRRRGGIYILYFTF